MALTEVELPLEVAEVLGDLAAYEAIEVHLHFALKIRPSPSGGREEEMVRQSIALALKYCNRAKKRSRKGMPK